MTESAIYLWSAVFGLHFTLSLYFIPGLQFAVWTLWSAFYTDRYSKWKVDHMKSRLDHMKCRVDHIKSKKVYRIKSRIDHIKSKLRHRNIEGILTDLAPHSRREGEICRVVQKFWDKFFYKSYLNPTVVQNFEWGNEDQMHSGSCSQLTLLCESNPEIMIIYTSTHETFITLLFSLTLVEHFFQSQDFQWFRSMIMNIYNNCDKLLNCQQGLMMNDKVLKW